MLAMLHLAAKIAGDSLSGLRVLHQLTDDAVRNPRSGLRRWVIRSNHYSTNPHELVDWAVVELHHDGSVALAVGLSGFLSEDGVATAVRRVPFRLADALMAEAVALAASHVRGLAGVGTILIRAQFLRNEDDRAPLIAVDNRLGNTGYASASFHQVPGSRAVRRVLPVEAQFSAENDAEALRDTARQLADDLDQQFGLRSSSFPA